MSQPLIIGAVTLAVIDTTVNDLRKSSSKGPSFRIVIGGFIVAIGLLALSDYQEDLADGLAILILLTTMFGPNGGALADLLTRTTKPGYVAPATQGHPIVLLPGYVDPNAAWYLPNQSVTPMKGPQ